MNINKHTVSNKFGGRIGSKGNNSIVLVLVFGTSRVTEPPTSPPKNWCLLLIYWQIFGLPLQGSVNVCDFKQHQVISHVLCCISHVVQGNDFHLFL